MKTLFLLSTLVIPISFGNTTPESLVQALTSQELIAAGKQSFVNRCSGCHGVNADGQGPAAPMLNPKPRNLVSGSFKFRSTPQGVLPTVGDLIRVIDQGVLGTAMPPFRDLATQEKMALVACIRSLRPEFHESRSEQLSVSLPPPPREIFSTKDGLLASAGRGKILYDQTCVACHGAEGRGNGPAAEGMTDSENQPVAPADLTARFIKSGKTPVDLYRSIAVGLDGSPMPAFGETFDEKKRWDLVAYIFYLRGLEAGIYTEKDTLK